MTEIEKQALALVNEVLAAYAKPPVAHWDDVLRDVVLEEALCRAIEREQAFRQEVSDAVEKILNCTNANKRYGACLALSRFIIAKPDPLVEVVAECGDGTWDSKAEYADKIRAALAARGLEIREKQ